MEHHQHHKEDRLWWKIVDALLSFLKYYKTETIDSIICWNPLSCYLMNKSITINCSVVRIITSYVPHAKLWQEFWLDNQKSLQGKHISWKTDWHTWSASYGHLYASMHCSLEQNISCVSVFVNLCTAGNGFVLFMLFLTLFTT